MNLSELMAGSFSMARAVKLPFNRNDVPVYVIDKDGEGFPVKSVELQDSGGYGYQVIIRITTWEEDAVKKA